MKKLNQSLVLAIVGICMVLHSNQGFAQIFGEYQSANMLGKGKIEINGHYNGVRISYDGESEFALLVSGLQTGFGLGDKFELRLRYDRVWYKDFGFGEGFNVISVAPKIGTNSDKVSFMLPVSTLFDSGGDGSWLISPTILFTFPLGESANLTFTPRYIISLEENSDISDSYLSLNVGFGIDFLEYWVARPELGITFIPGEKGNFFNFGVGVSRVLGKPKS